jgi:hypothetical protein
MVAIERQDRMTAENETTNKTFLDPWHRMMLDAIEESN